MPIPGGQRPECKAMGSGQRFAPTSITGAWDGAPSTLAALPATGFTGTISGRARWRPMPSPGTSCQDIITLGRESALEAHGMTHTY